MLSPRSDFYLTASFPGCGGRLKDRLEDFVVEEIPLYEPSGAGEHLYVLVEKSGLSTRAVENHLCKIFSLTSKQVGHAGLKDAFAIGRQWLSIHVGTDLSLHRAETDKIRILRVSRHQNKLRPGHLRGNRFIITVRNVQVPPGFASLLKTLENEGFPNLFGPQRVGPNFENAVAGRRLLRDGPSRRISREKARFLTNAYQGALFNTVLGRRMEILGHLGKMVPGDLAVIHRKAGFFTVHPQETPEAQKRADLHEISPSAPLFGYKSPLAEGLPGEWERQVLTEEGITPEMFKKPGRGPGPKGERRAVRAFPTDFFWEETQIHGEPCLLFRFVLDSGVYATSLLHEIMKPQAATQPLSKPPIHAPKAAGHAP